MTRRLSDFPLLGQIYESMNFIKSEAEYSVNYYDTNSLTLEDRAPVTNRKLSKYRQPDLNLSSLHTRRVFFT